MTCTRCNGSVRYDPREQETLCVACGARIYTSAELLLAARAETNRARLSKSHNRGPRTNGLSLG